MARPDKTIPIGGVAGLQAGLAKIISLITDKDSLSKGDLEAVAEAINMYSFLDSIICLKNHSNSEEDCNNSF